jgi:sulfate adenylyltransferase subunit 2
LVDKDGRLMGSAHAQGYVVEHLRALEAESIHVMREVAAELRPAALLFSGGKDSAVLLHLAEKAFWPAPIPFQVIHVDTGHNFPEVLEFRDRTVRRRRVRLIVASVQDSIDAGRVTEPSGPRASRNPLQSVTLLHAIEEHGLRAAIGGARRDEERSRAKERVFSYRDDFGHWDPKRQRPELWNLYNGHLGRGEHIRVFPLSNWTELDVWRYVRAEGIELPPIYFAHRREVFRREGMLYPVSPYVELLPGEEPFEESVRFRTVGDMTCTGAVPSNADTVDAVMAEIATTDVTERGETRADDRITEAGMEDRKREGYF